MNAGAIPAELRALPQWVVWRYENRAGKPTKVPYRADGAGKADTTDAATWAPFGDAVVAISRLEMGGVGYVFSADDPFTGVDLDDVLVEGVLHPAAAEIVWLLGSYTEASPSGTGVKIIVRASKGPNTRCRTRKTPWGGWLEVYDQDRFFALTGNRVGSETPVLDGRQEQLDHLFQQYLPPRTATGKGLPRTQAVDLDDRDLLERALHARNGGKFARLWLGNTDGYASPSEADAALLSMLAFWTNCDPARMERLFSGSALGERDKWKDRPDYRTRSVDAAIAGCTDTYTPPGPRLAVYAPTWRRFP